MRSFFILGFATLGSIAAVKMLGPIPCILAAVLFLTLTVIFLLLKERFLFPAIQSLLIAGVMLTCCILSLATPAPTIQNAEGVSFRAVITATGTFAEDVYTYTVRVTALNGEELKTDGYLYSDKAFSPFDVVSGTAEVRTSSQAINLLTESDVAKIGTAHSLSYYAYRVQNYIRERVQPLLRKEDYARLIGVLFGDTSAISQADRLSFSRAGLSHLFSVSGLHIAIFNGLLISLLTLFGVSPRRRMLISLLFLLPLAVFSGLSKSVLRAVLMAACVNVGSLFKRNTDSLNNLGFAVFILLLFDPNAVEDASFLLTVFATLGILLILPRLRRPIKRLPALAQPFVQAAAVSAAAYLSTFPILLLYFDEFSLIGVLVNVLLSPLFTILLPLCLLVCVFAILPFMRFAAVFCGHLCAALFALIDSVCRIANKIPFSYLPLDFPFVRIWYIIAVGLFIAAFVLRKRLPHTRILAGLLSVFLLCGGVLLQQHRQRTAVECIPIQSNYASALLIRDNRQTLLVVFSDDPYLNTAIARTLRAKGIDSVTLLARYSTISDEILKLSDAFSLSSTLTINENTVNTGVHLSDALQLEILSVEDTPCATARICGDRIFLPAKKTDSLSETKILSPDYPAFETTRIDKP